MAEKRNNYVIVEFQDGLQIVPITWLSTDLQRSKWPKHYVTNNRYNRAIKSMETPDETWEEHSVLKIYTCCDYTTAQEKLKLAELLSNINSDGREEKFKKT